jgi:hypothetical protein
MFAGRDPVRLAAGVPVLVVFACIGGVLALLHRLCNIVEDAVNLVDDTLQSLTAPTLAAVGDWTLKKDDKPRSALSAVLGFLLCIVVWTFVTILSVIALWATISRLCLLF